MSQDEINARIKISTEAYKARKAVQEQVTKDRKDGIAFIHDNKLPIMIRELNDNSVLTLTVNKTRSKSVDLDKSIHMYRFAYSLCSPKDQFSLKIAKGLIGKRLMDENEKFSFQMALATDVISPQALLQIGFDWISIMALIKDNKIPDRMCRTFAKTAATAADNWNTEFHGIE